MSEQEIAALLADWHERLDNWEKADQALFMHVIDLEPGVRIIEQLEQQLAHAQEENEQLRHAGRIDSASMRKALERAQAEQAKMRALLEPIGTRVPERHGEPICIYCYEILSEGATLGHKDDCLWLKIRAFLAAHPTEEEA